MYVLHVKAWGWHQQSFLFVLNLLIEEESLNKLGLAPSPQPPGIYTDDGGLNSNPYTYTATTLSTEPSLQSHFTIYFTLMGKSTNLSSYLVLQ